MNMSLTTKPYKDQDTATMKFIRHKLKTIDAVDRFRITVFCTDIENATG